MSGVHKSAYLIIVVQERGHSGGPPGNVIGIDDERTVADDLR
jgi:hypothetical protein